MDIDLQNGHELLGMRDDKYDNECEKKKNRKPAHPCRGGEMLISKSEPARREKKNMGKKKRIRKKKSTE